MKRLPADWRLLIGTGSFALLLVLATDLLLNLPTLWSVLAFCVCGIGLLIGASALYAKRKNPETPSQPATTPPPPGMIEAAESIDEANIGKGRSSGGPLIRTKRLGKFSGRDVKHEA
jgi:hypothetical protein